MHNSEEFIKSQLFVSQDNKTAYIHSADICHDLRPGVERDEAFDEAIAVIEKMGWKQTEQEIETVDGGCTQHFTRAN